MAPEIRPKRIAVVVPRYGLVGGGEKFVYELTERIALSPDFQIHVFANRWRKGSEAVSFHHVPILPFPRFIGPLSFAHFAAKKIKQLGVDLIHTHERIFDADLYTAHGIPHQIWVREVRRKQPGLFDLALMGIEKRLLTGRCRYVLPVSSLTRDRLIRAFPGIDHKTRVLTPGVDTTPFDRFDRRECRKQIRDRYGLTETDNVILFVGMNFEVKGLAPIMEAFAILKRRKPDRPVKLLVVGKGDESRYRKVADQLGIGADTLFTGTWRDEIAPVYLASDLFIMLSSFDTFGLTVLEAMSAGLPVVISPTVGARDVVQNGINGYIVDPGKPEEVGDRMDQILNPNAYKDMAVNAHRTADAHTWTAMADQMAALYREIGSPQATTGGIEKGVF